jgi:hypothetical protein
MNGIWLGVKDGLYYVQAINGRDAATFLRDHLVSRNEIRKYSSVTVELWAEINSSSESLRIYREVS